MHCGLEILQKNGVLFYEEYNKKFNILQILNTKSEPIKTITLPITYIYYENGKRFDESFRQQMNQLGFVCALNNNAVDGVLFIKKEDIKTKLINELPDLEYMYIEKIPLFVETYIYQECSDIQFELIGKLELEYFQKNYLKLIRLDIKEKRKKERDEKEKSQIEFMKRVLNG